MEINDLNNQITCEKERLELRLKEASQKLFYLWEFVSMTGMQDDAREYLEEHEDDAVPFEIAS